MIMSHAASFEDMAARFGMTLPDELLNALYDDLKRELQSIALYEDTLATITQLCSSPQLKRTPLIKS